MFILIHLQKRILIRICRGNILLLSVRKILGLHFLKWKGVEATQEIAKSTNSKVIVIGNGDGDLPIILGGQ